MKKLLQFLCFLSLLVFLAAPISSCNKKTGCPMNESVHTKAGKDGRFKAKKKGKSNLFPKDMRKKRKG